MVRTSAAEDLPVGLVDQLLDGPVLRPDRIAAGRWRAFCGPVNAVILAGLLVDQARRG